MYKKIIVVCGMPRSGTSWLGQLLDSSPDVAFRMEPLFSYQFKNIIGKNASKKEILDFFAQVYLTDDDFIHQSENRDSGAYCHFKKKSSADFLVIKTTRHHALLEHYLKLIENIDIISIVRHPCAVINSWVCTNREFTDKGCTVDNDWKNGQCRKGEEGEYWGFDDWLSVTEHHVNLNKKYDNFHLIKYSKLVNQTEQQVKTLFNAVSLPYGNETAQFIVESKDKNHENPYSVFKSNNVEHKWKEHLNESIAKKIITKTKSAGLGEFCE